MWTELPCKNFHLLLCCAILESEKQQIMEKHYGFNEILKVAVLSVDGGVLELLSGGPFSRVLLNFMSNSHCP